MSLWKTTHKITNHNIREVPRLNNSNNSYWLSNNHHWKQVYNGNLTFLVIIALGKFQGVIIPTTPIGCLKSSLQTGVYLTFLLYKALGKFQGVIIPTTLISCRINIIEDRFISHLSGNHSIREVPRCNHANNSYWLSNKHHFLTGHWTLCYLKLTN